MNNESVNLQDYDINFANLYIFILTSVSDFRD